MIRLLLALARWLAPKPRTVVVYDSGETFEAWQWNGRVVDA